MHPDQKFIDYLKNNNSKGIGEIYKRYAPMVKRMIVANSGTTTDAGDVFQDSLIDIFKLATKKDFTLTCSFEAFLIIVCKRKWLTKLKSGHKKKVTNAGDDLSAYEGEAEVAENYSEQIERENLVWRTLEKLDEKCREIIKSSLREENQMIAAEKLKISYGYFRKRKSICMARLAEMVKERQMLKT